MFFSGNFFLNFSISKEGSFKGSARTEHHIQNTVKFLRTVFQRKIQAVKTDNFPRTLQLFLPYPKTHQ